MYPTRARTYTRAPARSIPEIQVIRTVAVSLLGSGLIAYVYVVNGNITQTTMESGCLKIFHALLKTAGCEEEFEIVSPAHILIIVCAV